MVLVLWGVGAPLENEYISSTYRLLRGVFHQSGFMGSYLVTSNICLSSLPGRCDRPGCSITPYDSTNGSFVGDFLRMVWLGNGYESHEKKKVESFKEMNSQHGFSTEI